MERLVSEFPTPAFQIQLYEKVVRLLFVKGIKDGLEKPSRIKFYRSEVVLVIWFRLAFAHTTHAILSSALLLDIHSILSPPKDVNKRTDLANRLNGWTRLH
jgi:hypothetical protein